jgi:NAD(P)-dependent dehydrogenase (short-subunit alcohol dehydrogenase family)
MAGMTANRYAVDDKVVVITGGGTGMGRTIAQAFLSNGARVAVCGRRTLAHCGRRHHCIHRQAHLE